jgi:hypothetical protein
VRAPLHGGTPTQANAQAQSARRLGPLTGTTTSRNRLITSDDEVEEAEVLGSSANTITQETGQASQGSSRALFSGNPFGTLGTLEEDDDECVEATPQNPNQDEEDDFGGGFEPSQLTPDETAKVST